MYVAVIPARGGSKGIKDKNLQPVGGVSLVARAILSAQAAKIEKIIVSTDSEKIAQEAKRYGALVHYRSQETASDTAKTIDAVAELYKDMRLSVEDTCVLLQPTSPLREAKDVLDALTEFESQGRIGSVVSTVESEHHPYKMLLQTDDGIEPLHSKESLEFPRQSLPKALRVNGAVYVISFQDLLNQWSFFVEPISCTQMSVERSIDIDHSSDLQLANRLVAAGQFK